MGPIYALAMVSPKYTAALIGSLPVKEEPQSP